MNIFILCVSIIGYLIIGLLIGGIYDAIGSNDDDVFMLACVILAWPVMAIAIFMYLIGYAAQRIGNYLRNLRKHK